MTTPPILRANQLHRRARDLGTDVAHVVAFDATQQRGEASPEADDGQRRDIVPAVPDVSA